MAKEKKFKFNISERLFALAILNEFKGKLEDLADVLADIAQFRIDEEEWERAGRKVVDTQDGSTQWQWDDVKGGDKEITVKESVKSHLVSKLEEKNSAGEFSLADRAAIKLYEKLQA